MNDILTYGQFLDAVSERGGAVEIELYDRDGLRIDEGVDIPRFTKVIEHSWSIHEAWALLDWIPPEGTMHNKCHRFKDVVIKPDGENELDPCHYEEISRYENVTVSVLKCKRCGHIELAWHKQPNTIESHYENGRKSWGRYSWEEE